MKETELNCKYETYHTSCNKHRKSKRKSDDVESFGFENGHSTDSTVRLTLYPSWISFKHGLSNV